MSGKAAIIDWLRRDVAMEAMRMTLAAGMPGGSSYQRAKAKHFAEGVNHAVKSIIEAIERGDADPLPQSSIQSQSGES